MNILASADSIAWNKEMVCLVRLNRDETGLVWEFCGRYNDNPVITHLTRKIDWGETEHSGIVPFIEGDLDGPLLCS